jgi:3-oxoacyl-[acyl-carrier protein] reductase
MSILGGHMYELDLGDRVAIVTGAASGIGKESAIRLARAGAFVVCADINEAGAKDTAAEIGNAAEAVAIDVSDAGAVAALVTGTAAQHGRLDVMANIAGIGATGTPMTTDEAELDRIWAVNFKSVFYGTQGAARVMLEQGSGSIVNVSSGIIDSPGTNLFAYAIAKISVAQLSKAFAVELAPNGVRVNAIAPGIINTNLGDPNSDIAQHAVALTPMRRIGQPDDVADVVVFLASDASKYMTGQILRPNGGQSMPW